MRIGVFCVLTAAGAFVTGEGRAQLVLPPPTLTTVSTAITLVEVLNAKLTCHNGAFSFDAKITATKAATVTLSVDGSSTTLAFPFLAGQTRTVSFRTVSFVASCGSPLTVRTVRATSSVGSSTKRLAPLSVSYAFAVKPPAKPAVYISRAAGGAQCGAGFKLYVYASSTTTSAQQLALRASLGTTTPAVVQTVTPGYETPFPFVLPAVNCSGAGASSIAVKSDTGIGAIVAPSSVSFTPTA